MTRPVRSLRASSPMSRNSASDIDSTLRMVPMPLQRGQWMCVVSLNAGRNRCRESSSKPNRDNRPS